MIHVYCVSHVYSLVTQTETNSLSLSLSLSLSQCHLAVFVRLIWLFGDTRILFSGPKAKIKPKSRPHVIYMHCIYHAGWISVCFDQIKEVSKYCCLLFFSLIYLSIRYHL